MGLSARQIKRLVIRTASLVNERLAKSASKASTCTLFHSRRSHWGAHCLIWPVCCQEGERFSHGFRDQNLRVEEATAQETRDA
jgi:hypothetical protein